MFSAEISDETNESRAFSFFPICLNTGILIASFVGGTFGSSANFPGLIKAFPFFKTFPYLLPNLLAALLPAVVAIIAAIWLKETLPSKIRKDLPDTASSHTATPSEDNAKEETSYKSLFTPHINAIMFSFAVLSLLGGAQSAIQPLFCFTPIRDGGLGFSEKEIGISMSIRSIATVAVQVLAFPWLQRHVGTLRLYRWLMILWLPTYLGLPFVAGLARVGTDNGHKRKDGGLVSVWISLSATLLCSAVANMAFVCNLLMTNAAAPSRQLLGAINGEHTHQALLTSRLLPGTLFCCPDHRSRWFVRPLRFINLQEPPGRKSRMACTRAGSGSRGNLRHHNPYAAPASLAIDQ